MHARARAYIAVLAWPVAANIKSLTIPVFGTNIASGVRWDAAAANDDAENHEAQASSDLHDTKDKLDLFRSVSSVPCNSLEWG